MTNRDNVSAIEAEATGVSGVFELLGWKISIPPVSKWRTSALRALNSGDFDTWAEKTLSKEDYKVWTDLDPTLEEVNALFAEAEDFLGSSLGNSRASRR